LHIKIIIFNVPVITCGIVLKNSDVKKMATGDIQPYIKYTGSYHS